MGRAANAMVTPAWFEATNSGPGNDLSSLQTGDIATLRGLADGGNCWRRLRTDWRLLSCVPVTNR